MAFTDARQVQLLLKGLRHLYKALVSLVNHKTLNIICGYECRESLFFIHSEAIGIDLLRRIH
jgi:hypothetical protein